MAMFNHHVDRPMAVMVRTQTACKLLSISSYYEAISAQYSGDYLGSLQTLGIVLEDHDIRFVEDDWESPTSA